MAITSFSDITLGIACPMANEKKMALSFIQDVIDTCNTCGFKSISMFTIFDKVCTDGTYDFLRGVEKGIRGLKVVFAPENKCVVDAYIRGYKEALEHNCDWILEIDAGYSHQPSDIPKLFNKMKEGYDCVFGSRFCRGGKVNDINIKRYLISKFGTLLTNILLGTKLSDMTSGFELFSKTTLKEILNMGIRSRGPFFQTEIKTYAHKYKFAEVPIHYQAPSHTVGQKAINDAFGNLWYLFKNYRLKKNS